MNHGQVIGPISHGNGLVQGQAIFLCPLTEFFHFDILGHDVPIGFSGQETIDHFQVIGLDVINADLLRQAVYRFMKTARNQTHLVATGMEFIHQFLGPLVEMDAGKNLIENGLGQALEGSYPFFQSLFKVQFAPHGPLGDGSNLLANTRFFSQ